MIKIILLVGGVWFFLALLFVGALFAAHTKDVPKMNSQPALKPRSKARSSTIRTSSKAQPANESVHWELQKAVQA